MRRLAFTLVIAMTLLLTCFLSSERTFAATRAESHFSSFEKETVSTHSAYTAHQSKTHTWIHISAHAVSSSNTMQNFTHATQDVCSYNTPCVDGGYSGPCNTVDGTPCLYAFFSDHLTLMWMSSSYASQAPEGYTLTRTVGFQTQNFDTQSFNPRDTSTFNTYNAPSATITCSPQAGYSYFCQFELNFLTPADLSKDGGYISFRLSEYYPSGRDLSSNTVRVSQAACDGCFV